MFRQLFGLLEHTIEEVEEDLTDLIEIQSSEPSVKTDEYMRGLANGLICARSCVNQLDPVYIENKVEEYTMSKKDLIDMLVSQGKSWDAIIARIPAFKGDKEAKEIYQGLVK
jgi:hypothetical protein